MDIMQIGAQLLKTQLGTNSNLDVIAQALGQLLGAKNGQVDVAGLVSQLAGNSAVQSAVKSWLGGGANAAISPAQILEVFGAAKVGGFAQQVGVSPDSAAGGLAAVLPQLIDKASQGGSLLQGLGGVGGLLGAAKKLF